MADKSFDRFFAHAAVQAEAKQEREDPALQAEKRQKREEDTLRRRGTDMTAGDAIQRVLLADKDRDFFRMLALPLPEVDALGRPKWSVTPSEVSKAYRKLSVLVHPDKNPGDDARKAFEALNKAHRLLKDAGELEGILKEHLDRAVARREEDEARATLEERVAINARQAEEAKALRKQEGAALQEEIVRQMREKQERARKRKAVESSSKYRRRAAEEEGEGGEGNRGDSEDEESKKKEEASKVMGCDSDDEDAAQRRRAALAKRRQQLRKKAAVL